MMEAIVQPTQIVASKSSSMTKDSMTATGDSSCTMTVTMLEIQPWLSKFKTMCDMDQCSASSLTELMEYFIRNVRPIANECQTKPLRADKLKGFISETLLSFLYYYRAQEAIYDRDAFMCLMSDLLAMYIDMELKASKRSNEYHERISGRIASYLYVYLENSPEYLMDTLLKVQLVSSTYHQILDPLITKIFMVVPVYPSSCLMYVRYFLLYRLWKRITKDQNVRNDINSRAMVSLRTPPTSIPQYVMDHVLPKVPNSQRITAKLLLSQPIELEKSCEMFLQYCKKSSGDENADEVKVNRLDEPVVSPELEDNIPCESNLSTLNNSLLNNSLLSDININQSRRDNSIKQLDTSTPKISAKVSQRKLLKKKTDKVVLIDLTSDDINGKIIKQKKLPKRLSWIQNISRSNSTIINTEDRTAEKTQDVIQQLEDAIGMESLTIADVNSDLSIDEDNSINHLDLTSERTLFKLFGVESEDEDLDDNSHNSPDTTDLPKTTDFNTTMKNNEAIVVIPPKDVAATNDMTCEITVQTFTNINNDEHVEVSTTEMNSVNNFSEDEMVNRHEIAYTVEVNSDDAIINVNNDVSEVDITSQVTNSSPMDYTRKTVLHLNKCLTTSTNYVHEQVNISNEQLQHDHIDGLSLLASVSQELSHLETPCISRELIKVKDSNSLMTYTANTNDNDDTEKLNKIVNTYTDDIDKVALHVEVSSSDDVSDPSSSVYSQEPLDNYFSPNTLSNELPATPIQVDSSFQSDKDETNVILNGETIVLLQKSPNSNLYIINKAVENREHINESDETSDIIEKNTLIEKDEYSYEMYDSMYRLSQPVTSAPFDLSQRKTTKVKPEPIDETTRASSLELKNVTMKKSNNEAMSPRRRRVKQEFNGGRANVVSQDIVDTHTLHIPPSSSLSTMYHHSNYTTGDLFISCRQNCPTVACLPVNHPVPSHHSHSKASHCTCLNCTYDIVTHCSQCIIPPGKTDTTSPIDAGYYIPIQQSNDIQDTRTITKPQQFDEQLICKIEAKLNDQKPGKIYKSEMNSKLPLKKRFKCMITTGYNEATIKKEKIQVNYPSTPMISIASLETQHPLETTDKLIVHKIHSDEIIRRDYNKDVITGYRYSQKLENNKNPNEITYSTETVSQIKRTKGQIGRPSKKVKELKSPSKKPTRRTRSSQRKIPKINYSCMDVDSEWNPSIETKRKRKKTSR